MKTTDYEFEIDGVPIDFYHNQQTHRYEILIDYDYKNKFIISKAKGEAIASFLKFLQDRDKEEG